MVEQNRRISIDEKFRGFQIEKILNKKVKFKKVHYLVKWELFPEKFSTWESREYLLAQGNQTVLKKVQLFENKLYENFTNQQVQKIDNTSQNKMLRFESIYEEQNTTTLIRKPFKKTPLEKQIEKIKNLQREVELKQLFPKFEEQQKKNSFFEYNDQDYQQEKRLKKKLHQEIQNYNTNLKYNNQQQHVKGQIEFSQESMKYIQKLNQKGKEGQLGINKISQLQPIINSLHIKNNSFIDNILFMVYWQQENEKEFLEPSIYSKNQMLQYDSYSLAKFYDSSLKISFSKDKQTQTDQKDTNNQIESKQQNLQNNLSNQEKMYILLQKYQGSDILQDWSLVKSCKQNSIKTKKIIIANDLQIQYDQKIRHLSQQEFNNLNKELYSVNIFELKNDNFSQNLSEL